MPGAKNYDGYVGQKFGLLTLEEVLEKRNSHGRVMGRFKCECGNYTEKPLSKTVQLLYKSCGCLTTSHPKAKKGMRLTWKRKQELGELYKQGAMASELASKYNMARSSVLDIVDKLGIKRHTQTYSNRKYNRDYLGIDVDEDAFSSVDPGSEEAPYWIGFMLADGRMFEPNSISILLKDRDHLVKFRDFLKSTHAIGEVIRQKDERLLRYWQFQLHNQKLYDDLGSYGIVPRKSLIAEPPRSLINNRHFWRGMVDGDGTLSSRFINHYETCYIRLSGTLRVCSEFLSYIDKQVTECGNRPYVRKNFENCVESSIGGKKAKRVIKHLYEGAQVYLTRKMDIARQLF